MTKRKVALWRQIENMSVEERTAELYHCKKVYLIDVDTTWLDQEPAGFRPDENGDVFTLLPIDNSGINQFNFFLFDEWKAIRQSFTHNKEWKTFRNALIEERGFICERCGMVDPKIVVHHKENIAYRVVEHGFLSDLENKDKFELLCNECHINEHTKIISAFSTPQRVREKKFKDKKVDVFLEGGKVVAVGYPTEIVEPTKWDKTNKERWERFIKRIDK